MFKHLFSGDRRAKNSSAPALFSVTAVIMAAVTAVEFQNQLPSCAKLFVTVSPDRSIVTPDQRRQIMALVYANRMAIVGYLYTQVQKRGSADEPKWRNVFSGNFDFAGEFSATRKRAHTWSKDQTGR